VNELVKTRDELLNEKDKLLDELVKLREVLEEAQGRNLEYERKLEEANNTISQLDTDINTRKMEAQREGRRKDRIERELKEAKALVDQKVGVLGVDLFRLVDVGEFLTVAFDLSLCSF